MKNFVKGFLMATLIFAVTITGFAASKKQSIDVELNPAIIQVEGEVKNVDHFIYNGTTYVPVRALSEALDVEVDWDDGSKIINLYKFEPREYSTDTFMGMLLPLRKERNAEYDRVLGEVQKDLINIIDYLNNINLPENPIDEDTFIELQDRRSAIEGKLYSISYDVNYRTPIFMALKALDNVEIALIRAHSSHISGSPERIRLNLDKAAEYAEFILYLGM